jgi:hypothetical protein
MNEMGLWCCFSSCYAVGCSSCWLQNHIFRLWFLFVSFGKVGWLCLWMSISLSLCHAMVTLPSISFSLHTLYTIILCKCQYIGAIYFYTLCIILFFFDEWCFFLCFSPSCPGWRKSRWLFFMMKQVK